MMTPQSYIETVQQALVATETSPLECVVDILYRAFLEGRAVFTFGNGASAALASHMATDIGKLTSLDLGAGPVVTGSRRLRILSLNDNPAWMTALGNDVAYEDVFLEQLKNHLRLGDVVLGISGSGGSPNVLRALDYARALGATTIGFTGQQAKAEEMRTRCDICMQAPVAMMEQIEDLHVIYHHIVTRRLYDRVKAGTAA
jgi:D-sedoheptulose 7-phosphate isomerase